MNSEEEEISRDRDVVDGDGGLGARLLQNPCAGDDLFTDDDLPSKTFKGVR